MKLCDYGCDQEAKFQFQNGKFCCSIRPIYCIKVRSECVRKMIERIRGRTKENDDGRRKQAEKITGRTKETHEGVRKGAEKLSAKMKGNEQVKQNLKNARKQIKNPSEPELKLRETVKELFSTSEHTYSILNYEVDNTLPEFKIAIEYDGWYHFDTEEHKQYHKKRQKEIEKEGWKFLRYNIFQKFPTKEEVEKDLKNILDCKNFQNKY